MPDTEPTDAAAQSAADLQLLDLRDRGIYWCDLLEGGQPHRTSAYLIAAPEPAVIETGGTTSQPQVLAMLRDAGVAPEDVRYIAVTHVHADHAGGAGALSRVLPNARVVVHERGAKHLVEPERLWQGTLMVHGEAAARYFGPMEPVAEPRLLVPQSGDALDLGGGHRLEIIDTPGHALHHFAFFDRGAKVLWPGDVMGIRYPTLSTPGDHYVLPSTAPNQFDPKTMQASCERLAQLPVEAVAFSHFGPSAVPVAWLAERVGLGAHRFVEAARAADTPGELESVKAALFGHVQGDVEASGRPWSDAMRSLFDLDMTINARGVLAYFDWLAKQNKG